jgi:hypothetical protein
VSDSLSLCQHTGATLLVVKAGSTPEEAIQQSIDSIGRTNLIGMVLNGAEGIDRLYSHYGYYRAATGTPSK